VKPGFNVFSAEQDVEIGRQSAVEAEKQLPLLNDRNTQAYVESVFSRLAAQAPGTKFPYQIRVVNARDINAFALPGGFTYVNRGAITAARTEGELAGVLAHEISHVALRHGTNNATKSYMTQAGLGVLGGILGRGKPESTAQIINIIGGLGMNAVFLKYSRDAETQADIVGRRSWPAPVTTPWRWRISSSSSARRAATRAAGPRSSSATIPPRQSPGAHPGGGEVDRGHERAPGGGGGEFARVQANLRGMGTAPTMAEIAKGGGRTSSTSSYPSGRTPQGRQTGAVRVDAPSTRYTDFRQRDDFFEMQIPSNWRAYEADNGFGVTIAPEGGVVDNGDGQQSIIYGVIVNHYDPFEGSTSGRRNATIEQASAISSARSARGIRISRPPGADAARRSTASRATPRLSPAPRRHGRGGARHRGDAADGRRAHPLHPADRARPRLHMVSTAFNRMVQSLRRERRCGSRQQPAVGAQTQKRPGASAPGLFLRRRRG
jgi:hypothetical protein